MVFLMTKHLYFCGFGFEAKSWKPDGAPDFGEPVPDGLLLQ